MLGEVSQVEWSIVEVGAAGEGFPGLELGTGGLELGGDGVGGIVTEGRWWP